MELKSLRSLSVSVLIGAAAFQLLTFSAFGQQMGGLKGNGRLRIAILNFKLVGAEQTSGLFMIDRLRSDLVNTGKFIVLDRAQSDKIVEELARQQGGLTDEATAIEIGKQFNVQRIVTGRVLVQKEFGLIQINVEMIDMKSAQILLSQTITFEGKMREFILQEIPKLANRLAGVKISGDGVVTESTSSTSKPKGAKGGSALWPWIVGGSGALIALVEFSTAADFHSQSQDLATTDPLESADLEGQRDAAANIAIIGTIAAAGAFGYLWLSDNGGSTAFKGRWNVLPVATFTGETHSGWKLLANYRW